jgi:Glycosyltransferase family 28 N-terminal domain
MQIMLIALGSRGDVQPYVALGKGLHAAGYSVRMMTHVNFEQLVTFPLIASRLFQKGKFTISPIGIHLNLRHIKVFLDYFTSRCKRDLTQRRTISVSRRLVEH